MAKWLSSPSRTEEAARTQELRCLLSRLIFQQSHRRQLSISVQIRTLPAGVLAAEKSGATRLRRWPPAPQPKAAVIQQYCLFEYLPESRIECRQCDGG